MKPEIRERRVFMVEAYGRSFSLREAVELTARRFQCEKMTLYVDWNRRGEWFKELCDLKETTTLIRQMIMDIFWNLKDIEEMRSMTKNDSIKLGTIKLAINTRLKLIELLRDFGYEELAERIEALERLSETGVFVP